MSEITGKALDIDLLSRVLKYVKPYQGRFIFTFFLTIGLAALSPLRPMLIQYAFDNYIVMTGIKNGAEQNKQMKDNMKR